MEKTNTNLKNPLEILFNETEAQRTGESLQPGSTATPFSTFFWAALSYTHEGVRYSESTPGSGSINTDWFDGWYSVKYVEKGEVYA